MCQEVEMVRLKWIVSLVFLQCFAVPGWANAVAIKVEVVIAFDTISNAWGESTKQRVLAKTRKGIQQVLLEQYPYWDFKDDSEPQVASVRLTVIDPNPDDNVVEANLKFEGSIKGHVDFSFEKLWLDSIAIQYRRFPSADKMADNLVYSFKQLMMNDPKFSFRPWIYKTIPIGIHASWMGDNQEDYFLVLSVKESKFENLNASIFRVIAHPENSPGERLEVQGQERFVPYPVKENEQPFRGIYVIVKGREVLGDKRALEPAIKSVRRLGPIYLEEVVSGNSYDTWSDEGGYE